MGALVSAGIGTVSKSEHRFRRTSAKIRTGISGWTYPPWRGDFYPAKLPHNRELAFAASKLNSIEINGSFYSLQLPTSYHRWRGATPDDFMFSVKGARFITHMKRLTEAGLVTREQRGKWAFYRIDKDILALLSESLRVTD